MGDLRVEHLFLKRERERGEPGKEGDVEVSFVPHLHPFQRAPRGFLEPLMEQYIQAKPLFEVSRAPDTRKSCKKDERTY